MLIVGNLGNMLKILLIGGLGFIGKRFIRRFADSDTLIVYAKQDDIDSARGKLDFSKFTVEVGDIVNDEVDKVIMKHKPDAVIHLAALTGIKKCHDNPRTAFFTNVFGTFNVVTGCVKCNSKLVFISSREVYGETLTEKTSENEPLRPNNVYGVTKMLGEMLVSWAGQLYNLDYTILRLTNVYGPEGDQYGVQLMIQKALKEGKIQILGGNQRLNFVYVEDVVDAIYKVLTDNRASREIFNVGSEDSLTMEEFVSRLSILLGRSLKVEHAPMRETETLHFKPSLEKLKMLGFTPSTDLTVGLRKTVEWYQKQLLM